VLAAKQGYRATKGGLSVLGTSRHATVRWLEITIWHFNENRDSLFESHRNLQILYSRPVWSPRGENCEHQSLDQQVGIVLGHELAISEHSDEFEITYGAAGVDGLFSFDLIKVAQLWRELNGELSRQQRSSSMVGYIELRVVRNVHDRSA